MIIEQTPHLAGYNECSNEPRDPQLIAALKDEDGKGIAQKGTDISLIARLLYPKCGPGQLCENVVAMGGQIGMRWKLWAWRLMERA